MICQYLSSELRASSQSNELSKNSRVVMEFNAQISCKQNIMHEKFGLNGFEIKMMVYQAQFISKMAGLAVLINQ